MSSASRTYANELFVDPVRRDEEPEAADERRAREDRGEDGPLGARSGDGRRARRATEDDDARLFGTHDTRSDGDGRRGFRPTSRPRKGATRPEPIVTCPLRAES